MERRGALSITAVTGYQRIGGSGSRCRWAQQPRRVTGGDLGSGTCNAKPHVCRSPHIPLPRERRPRLPPLRPPPARTGGTLQITGRGLGNLVPRLLALVQQEPGPPAAQGPPSHHDQLLPGVEESAVRRFTSDFSNAESASGPTGRRAWFPGLPLRSLEDCARSSLPPTRDVRLCCGGGEWAPSSHR